MEENKRECSPKESVRRAIEEMRQIRQGIIPKRSIQDILKDIEEEK